MYFDHFSFGTIRIDGVTREYDVVVDHGEIRKRKKGPSKQFADGFGHTPLSIEEEIPWKCHRLVSSIRHCRVASLPLTPLRILRKITRPKRASFKTMCGDVGASSRRARCWGSRCVRRSQRRGLAALAGHRFVSW